MDRHDLQRQVMDAKDRLMAKLEQDYGKSTFRKMYWDSDGMLRPFAPVSEASVDRLKRKLLIKILSAQTALENQEGYFNGCDCIRNASIAHQIDNMEAIATNRLSRTFAKYVWATGGHSAAAGHGNLFNESYTAVMESDLKDVFASIGISFEGRNYAMGGTTSAAEISMCWKEIFGEDVDFFSWDYGMTDAGHPLRILHYGYRGGISKGRPGLLVVRILNGDQELGLDALKALEDAIGMPVFLENGDKFSAMRDEIPDSAGLSTVELNNLPDLVRNFKCNGVAEKGDPYCGDEKYSDSACRGREGKAPWHPGWKRHAMVGHALSLFLLEALSSAVEELVNINVSTPEELLGILVKEEAVLYQNASGTTAIQKLHHQVFPLDTNSQVNATFSDPSILFDGPSLCHTARLPSRTRYLGHLTEAKEIGGPSIFGQEMYDTGIPISVATDSKSSNATVPLVWDDADKWRHKCEAVVNPDYKDFFFAKEGHGWRQLVIPNPTEAKAYRFDPNKVQGYVFVVLVGCPWGQCEDGMLMTDDIAGESRKWEMKINGVTVDGLVDIGHDALLAKSNRGLQFSPSESGDYKIEMVVNEASGFVKVSSIIIY